MKSRRIFGAVLIASTLLTANALAQTKDETVAHDRPFGSAAKLDGNELARAFGSADLSMVIAAKNSSNVSDNVINGGSVTGGISFDQASLSNLTGLSVLSANTGNNVAINSSLNLNVAIHP